MRPYSHLVGYIQYMVKRCPYTNYTNWHYDLCAFLFPSLSLRVVSLIRNMGQPKEVTCIAENLVGLVFMPFKGPSRDITCDPSKLPSSLNRSDSANVNCCPPNEASTLECRAPDVQSNVQTNCGAPLAVLVGALTLLVAHAAASGLSLPLRPSFTTTAAGNRMASLSWRHRCWHGVRQSGIRALRCSSNSMREGGGFRITPWRSASMLMINLAAVLLFGTGVVLVLGRETQRAWGMVYVVAAAVLFLLCLWEFLPRMEAEVGDDGDGHAIVAPRRHDDNRTSHSFVMQQRLKGKEWLQRGALGASKLNTGLHKRLAYRLCFDPLFRNGRFMMLKIVLFEVIEIAMQIAALEQTAPTNNAYVVVLTMTLITLNALVAPGAVLVAMRLGKSRFEIMEVVLFIELFFDEMFLAINLFLRTDTGAQGNETFISQIFVHASILYPAVNIASAARHLLELRSVRSVLSIDGRLSGLRGPIIVYIRCVVMCATCAMKFAFLCSIFTPASPLNLTCSKMLDCRF